MADQNGGQQIQVGGVNKNSAPSQLRITDMRAIRIASNYDYPIIKIETNQGVYGLGEVRDAGNEGMALVLKPHIVGRNPLDQFAAPPLIPDPEERTTKPGRSDDSLPRP